MPTFEKPNNTPNKNEKRLSGQFEEYNRSVEKAQARINKGLQRFEDYESKMETASPQKLEDFVKFCEKGIAEDPLVKEFPDLRNNYMNLRRKALVILGEKGFEIISQETKNARMKPADIQEIEIERALNDLDYVINAWQLKSNELELNQHDREEFQRLSFDAKDYRDRLLL